VLKTRKLALDHVIVIEADEAALIQRVVNRANEARAAGKPVRSDDDPEVFKKRLATYKAETAPVLPYYARQGKVRKVDGMKPIDEVTAQIEAALAAPPPRRSWLWRLFFG
jgi:adenylate kinase